MNEKKILYDVLSKFNLNEEAVKKIFNFVKEIYIYNQKVNLTGIKDYKQFVDKNIYDSLLIINLKIFEKVKIALDFGTGGGFPGLLLAIIYPNIKFILVDSSHKKTDWLNYISKKLDLKNIEIINERIENLNYLEEKIDLVLARAVAPLILLLEISTFLLKKNKISVFYKGKNYEKELEKIDNLFYQKHGLKLQKIIEDKLLDDSKRYFIIYKRKNLNYQQKMINYQKIKKMI
ncbi:16S rRNA (guanine(527)-N(7))-methyltransferase RsmG [Candidatus Hepatoplasma crinochetorum]|uniref:Ribosomal RNA small subunit methyltransferase G n=1 Tax=Candidatus Hepatoplasma crinochetorum Av TaxID=1427984 RepID=W8GK97_9MOLU|nr:16S rRNA (guanine(527)-N(7))-methyltransferase RsmG [Candidatus Hepatoplasma crinochetorum]AHK22672.1 Ribosomal RNA small subunit methyltransferase G [Candidatus Hepatoplasma crinochetorum Av]BDV03246.1 MAG: ribosomal RNA small subunit methyltransferase G [Candidatus Hepatoplasma crinochetorum]